MKVSFYFPLNRKKFIKKQKRETIYVRTGKGYSLLRSGVRSLNGSNMSWTRSSNDENVQQNKDPSKALKSVGKFNHQFNQSSVLKSSVKTLSILNPVNTWKSSITSKSNLSSKPYSSPNSNPDSNLNFESNLVQEKIKYSIAKKLLPNQNSQDSAKGNADSVISNNETLYVRTGNIGNKLRLMTEMEQERKRKREELEKERVKELVKAWNAKTFARKRVRYHLNNARLRKNTFVRKNKQEEEKQDQARQRPWLRLRLRPKLQQQQQQCQFFCRFGKCAKQQSGTCKYLHNKDHVAICTRFLNSKCTNTNCLLTHKIIPEKMPDCSYFQQGICVNINCPYRHVRVNPSSLICKQFLKGYCRLGNQCEKKHTYECPSYMETGKCKETPTCHLHHPKSVMKSEEKAETVQSSSGKVSAPKPKEQRKESKKSGKRRYFELDGEGEVKKLRMAEGLVMKTVSENENDMSSGENFDLVFFQ